MSLTPRLDRLEKNYLINGAMDYFQRNTSAGITGSSNYVTVDRFQVWHVSNGTAPTSQRSTNVPNRFSRYSHQFVSPSDNVGHTLNIMQRVEAIYARELANNVVSFSAWVYSENATTVKLAVAYAGAEDNWTTQVPLTTLTATVTTGSWQLIKFENISIPDAGFAGLQFILSVTGMTTLNVSKSHYVTQTMLNAGSTAATFARAGRTITDELNLCQRYYEKSYDDAGISANGARSMIVPVTTPNVVNCEFFMVTKRIIPTLAIYSPSGTLNRVWDISDTNSGTIVNSPVQIGTTGWRYTNFNAALPPGVYMFHYTADAEL